MSEARLGAPADIAIEPGDDSPSILEVRGLKTHFFTEDGVVKAVDGVDFSVRRGELFGVVGESGCGKTVTALSILRLIDSPGKTVDGTVIFDGKSLLDLPEDDMNKLRGSRMSMIFQQPISSLNPVFSVGDQVAEVLRLHEGLEKEEAWTKAVDLLDQVGIPDAESRSNAFPHELSGGQAQRVMIAIALALKPHLLIADEPTTALDVTIQAQILDLLRDLSRRWNTAVILITHDLGVIAEMVDRVAVMYAGRIVELSSIRELFKSAKHPYTVGLMESIPVLGQVKERLDIIPGSVPNLINLPPGCRFAPRCRPRVENELEICIQVEPDLEPLQFGHSVSCWLYHDHEKPGGGRPEASTNDV